VLESENIRSNADPEVREGGSSAHYMGRQRRSCRDVPLPVGRMVLLAARDVGCSSVPIVVDASGPTVRWRRLGPDENLSTWRAAGPFNSAEGLELVLERVAPWCR